MTRLYSGVGHPLELGKALGRGGEGAVFEITGRPGFVAKVYHQPISADKALKLEGMARQAHPSLLEIAAWPVDVLRSRPDTPIQGFIMPKVSGYQEIHSLYGPSHRKRAFPQADWSFLIHAARNLASAFEAIHARGHVIGDVNPGNVVVSAQALVKLIDCDSFQVSVGSRLFPCDVGVPQFTAPELQGRSFHGLRRTPEHDVFSLALMCFHLLFMGRHPFAGRYKGKGDMPIERAIKEYRFAFGQHAVTQLMEPPPHTLPFTALSREVATLFERAFAAPNHAHGNRPSAHEWLLALEQLKRELRNCRQNEVHKFSGHLSACPWCVLEQASGAAFFISQNRAEVANDIATDSDFNLDQVWKRILAVAPPGNEAMPAPAFQAPITPTLLPGSLLQIRRSNLLKVTAIAVVGLIALVLRPQLVWLWLPLAVAAWSLSRDDALRREYQRRRLALVNARQELATLRETWREQATDQPFTRKLQDLQSLRSRYQSLHSDYQQAVQRLETDQQRIQLQKFLESHFIDDAQIPGILTTDRMALESYGIETAADVSPDALQGVPGFGHRLGHQRAAALLNWRKELEKQFRYDSRQRPNPAEVALLRQQYAQKRRLYERELLAGSDELNKIKAEILKQRAQINMILIRQAAQEIQAQTDMVVFYPGLGAFWRKRIRR
ncbi:MAG: hypothetical protein U1F42_07515 [Candidatus Competibacteraceae bacterium]